MTLDELIEKLCKLRNLHEGNIGSAVVYFECTGERGLAEVEFVSRRDWPDGSNAVVLG